MQVWKLLLCDPKGSWTPCEREAAELAEGRTSRTNWAKYRNLVVRWEALQTVLQAAVDTAGNMSAYREAYAAGQWWWLSTATATMPAGPDDTQTCKRAREQGIID